MSKKQSLVSRITIQGLLGNVPFSWASEQQSPVAPSILSTLLPPVRSNDEEIQCFRELKREYDHALKRKVDNIARNMDISFESEQGDSLTLGLMVPYLPFDSPHKTFERDYEMRPISKYVVGLLVRAVTTIGILKAKVSFSG